MSEITGNGIDDDCNSATPDINDADRELTDYINDSSIKPGDLRTILIGQSPLSEYILNVLINADSGKRMPSRDYKQVLIANSPLPSSILDQINAGTPSLKAGDLQAVLEAQ